MTVEKFWSQVEENEWHTAYYQSYPTLAKKTMTVSGVISRYHGSNSRVFFTGGKYSGWLDIDDIIEVV